LRGGNICLRLNNGPKALEENLGTRDSTGKPGRFLIARFAIPPMRTEKLAWETIYQFRAYQCSSSSELHASRKVSKTGADDAPACRLVNILGSCAEEDCDAEGEWARVKTGKKSA
jgi:hypothetical protein